MASKSKDKSTSSGKSSDRTAAARKESSARIRKREELRRKRETRGIICIAVAVLLGIYLFVSGTGILGQAASRLLFGLFGWPAYILPVILLITGIMIIRGSREDTSDRNTDWMFFAATWDIVTLAQLIRNVPYKNVDYFKYLSQAYQDGSLYRRGGGGVGAVMCYPFQQLGGNALAYVILITVLLVILIMLTRFSLQKTGEKVGESVQSVKKNLSARAKKNLFMVEVVDEDPIEEFDNPFLPERKKNPRSELEGFDSALQSPQDSRKPERSVSGLEGFDKAVDSLPMMDLDSVPPVRRVRPGAGRTGANQALTLDEYGTFSPPVKQAVKKVSAPEVIPEESGSGIWSDLDPNVKHVRDLPKKKKGEPVPFAPLTNSFEVPSFLSDKASSKPVVPGFTAEEPAEEAEQKPAPKKRRTSKPSPETSEKTAGSSVPKQAAAADYKVPPFDLLTAPSATATSGENPNESARILVDTLNSFNIAVRVTDYSVGPVVTRFELQPAPGVRVSKIIGLSNDIALALAAPRVRIEAPIPGKAAVGIEIPNKKSIPVILREIVESKEFQKAASPITLAFGKDIAGKVITADLAKMPHLLIAGSTGSGKSVCINDLIVSMVYKSSPQDLRMILVDPKVVELSVYKNLPHLLIPVVTEPKKAASALRWAVNEMMTRYRKFSEKGTRDLDRFNTLVGPEEHLPKLVVIIDELADLMMVAPDEVEDSICRIAQLGRAAGIHLIVATQRPSSDIITGLIKANIPSRCAFAVSSGVDSRIILDAMGAEKLLGKGDMLFHPTGASKATRVQCAYVSDEEVERVVSFFEAQNSGPVFDDKLTDEITSDAGGSGVTGATGNGKQEDELLPEAVGIVLESGSASISMIQRRLRVGYARAARLIDIMEQKEYVSGFEGSKPRRVLITKAEYNRLFGNGAEEEIPEDVEDEDDLSEMYGEEPEI